MHSLSSFKPTKMGKSIYKIISGKKHYISFLLLRKCSELNEIDIDNLQDYAWVNIKILKKDVYGESIRVYCFSLAGDETKYSIPRPHRVVMEKKEARKLIPRREWDLSFLDAHINKINDIQKRQLRISTSKILFISSAILGAIAVVVFGFYTLGSRSHIWSGNRHLTSGGNWSSYQPKTGNYGPTSHNMGLVMPTIVLAILSVILLIAGLIAKQYDPHNLLIEARREMENDIKREFISQAKKTYKQPKQSKEWKDFYAQSLEKINKK